MTVLNYHTHVKTILLSFVCLLIASQFPFINGFIIPTSSISKSHAGSFGMRVDVKIQLSDNPKEGDNQVEEKTPEQLQMELEEMVKQPGYFECLEPDKVVDQSELPIPLFTGLVVFIGSIAFTIYTFYIGIFGFPDDGPSSLPPLQ